MGLVRHRPNLNRSEPKGFSLSLREFQSNLGYWETRFRYNSPNLTLFYGRWARVSIWRVWFRIWLGMCFEFVVPWRGCVCVNSDSEVWEFELCVLVAVSSCIRSIELICFLCFHNKMMSASPWETELMQRGVEQRMLGFYFFLFFWTALKKKKGNECCAWAMCYVWYKKKKKQNCIN